MEYGSLKLSTRGFYSYMFALLMLLLSSCSRKLHFARSMVVPAAEGTVKIKKDNNKNYSLDIDIRNLVESDKLVPPRKTYVAWIETDQDRNKNIGRLNSSSGLFSKTLKASLNTVTPFKPEKVFVTAENDAEISYPNGEVILTTSE